MLKGSSNMFKLEFKTDNAAFEDLEYAVAEILDEVKAKVANGARSGIALDYNGNRVGEWSVE